MGESSSTPLYLQIREQLLEIIHDQPAGAVLPKERDFALERGVSRITVRNAYQKLVEEGHVTKAHKAYKVAPKLPSSGLFMLDGFTKDAVKRGQKHHTQVIGIECLFPTDEIREALLTREGARVWRLHRVRFLNDEPVAQEYAYLNENDTPDLDKYQLTSLYQVLQREYKIEVYRAQQVFNFCFDDLPENSKVKIEGVPVLHLKRISYSSTNQPFEYIDAFYELSKFEYVIEVRK